MHAFGLSHTHTRTQSATDLGSITETEHHTLVWALCLTQCLQPLSRCTKNTRTQQIHKHTQRLPNGCVQERHVAVVRENEIELSNAGLRWLVSLMNSLLFHRGRVLCQSWQTSSSSHSPPKHMTVLSLLLLQTHTVESIYHSVTGLSTYRTLVQYRAKVLSSSSLSTLR